VSILTSTPFRLAVCTLLLTLPARAQQDQQVPTGSSSSSTTNGNAPSQIQESTSRARIARTEAGGSAITLETSEPLFDIAVALNACGYDNDLANSSPVRATIRQEISDELDASAPARESRDAICKFVREHVLTDHALDLAQYISLGLYTLPPPGLTPSVGLTDLPPDSTQVVEILPLLRTFNEQLHLHALWVHHLPDYQALTDRIHGPLTKTVLDTNVYLRLPVSSYDGRRFLVLVEPMLAPSSTNARIYADDYIAVGSPSVAGTIHMDTVRHIYLQYMVEPLIYARAAAMDRLLPLLKPIREAPIDFIYKSDITAYITECMIRAIEARTLTFDFPKPIRPNTSDRSIQIKYDSDLGLYERKAEAVRRERVTRDQREGWALTGYFYEQLLANEHGATGLSASLKEDIGQMVYGMDVDRERKHEEQIAFLPPNPNAGIRRAPAPITGIKLAELQLMKGKLDDAEETANTVLEDPHGDHAEAHYVLGQVNLLENVPEAAIDEFNEAVKTSRNPRTVAWSHIYLGRLYDVHAERPKALNEYKMALNIHEIAPDTKMAAEKGLKTPFATPKRAENPTATDDDNEPLDPSGKAAKEAYKPDPK
jgi:tetratricopeptide (TPR) repeat protein